MSFNGFLFVYSFHVDLQPFPSIVRIDRLCHNHSAFRHAHPLMQVDFPAEILTDSSFFQAKLWCAQLRQIEVIFLRFICDVS